MIEGQARFGMFIESLIFVAIFLAIGFVIALIYTKISRKTFDDLPKHYWGFFVILGFIAKFGLISLLNSLS